MSRSILSDAHLHSDFSGDCAEPMENNIVSAIDKGLKYLTVTEHLDIDFPYTPVMARLSFELDIDAYKERLYELKEKYKSKITMLWGIELGLQPHINGEYEKLLAENAFDFVIGSSHVAYGKDPYMTSFYEGRSEWEAHHSYFESILEIVSDYNGFDVYGHLDYVVRYFNQDKNYSYALHKDVIDEILIKLIHAGKGIEINTASLRKGMTQTNPCSDILVRYRELGGSIITVGSDAHEARFIASNFERARQILQECGFTQYCVFKQREAMFLEL